MKIYWFGYTIGSPEVLAIATSVAEGTLRTLKSPSVAVPKPVTCSELSIGEEIFELVIPSVAPLNPSIFRTTPLL